MLLQNGNLSGSPLSFLGGVLGAYANARSRHGWSIANARAFGSSTSYPQGYSNDRGIKMPLKTSGNISARFIGDGAFSASISAVGNMAATLQGNGTLSANAQMGAALYATLQGEGSLSATITALGNMSARLDAGARPSAFDIAQETWQSQATQYNSTGTMGAKVNAAGAAGDPWAVTLEGTYTAADLLRIAASVLAGDATGTNQPGTTVFKSLDGTKDRVTATQTEGARTITARDAS